MDIAKALFMLGELTIPNGMSRASPARIWAWIRYFSAVATTDDLRITEPFVELDPHQKGILSDDFGVALSMCWLFDRLNGFSEVVDGRRFVLQFKSHLQRQKRNTPKVGAGKCPDFVIRDSAGKWHTIECKGTQSSSGYRNQQMKIARVQKKCIDIIDSLKGFSLAGGVFLAPETHADERSNILIVDPEVEPYVTIEPSTLTEAKRITRRLAVSRALGLAGAGRLSDELSLPPDMGDYAELLTFGERARLSRPRHVRIHDAAEEIRLGIGSRVESGNVAYRGRSVDIEIPGDEFSRNTGGCKRVRIQQGVSEEFVDALLSHPGDIIDNIDGEADRFLTKTTIDLKSTEGETLLRQGTFYFARMEFLS